MVDPLPVLAVALGSILAIVAALYTWSQHESAARMREADRRRRQGDRLVEVVRLDDRAGVPHFDTLVSRR